MSESQEKKKINIPHSLAIIVAVMLGASILTYVIPAGVYERVVNDAGQTVVDPNSFHFIENTPVNPITIFTYIYGGLESARGFLFGLMASGGGLGVVLSTGILQRALGSFAKKVRGKEWIAITLVMGVFCILAVPLGVNAFIPFAVLGLVMGNALGMDAIGGISLVFIGGSVGFACGAMNLPNTGTAQSIAELPLFSGMWYRLLSMIPFFIVAVVYVVRYNNRIKADPTKSYVYGLDLGNDAVIGNTEIGELTKKDIPVCVVFIISMLILIAFGVQGKLGNPESVTIYTYMALAIGIAAKMSINDICKTYIKGCTGMAATGMLIGFAYAITGILNHGNIMDTIVYVLAGLMNYVPNFFRAPAMFLMHICINFLVTSGSGQAAATMPIMVPVADLCGITRQTAVLAFNFGDGFCNNILPHAVATMGFVGAANIPFSQWFKFMIKLFLMWVVVGIILLMIATAIGYS